MASPLRMIFSVSVLCSAAAGCNETFCVIKNAQDLSRVVADDACVDILIARSDLEDLSGIEALGRSAAIQIVENDRLMDVSQLHDITGSIELSNNPALTRVILGPLTGFLRVSEFAIEPVVEEIRFTFVGEENPEPDNGTYFSFVYESRERASALREVAIDSPEGAESTWLFNAAGLGAQTLEGRPTRLVLNDSPINGHAFLKPLGIPNEIDVGAQRESVARAYLSWLTENGFTGHFEACVFEADDVSAECTPFSG